MIIYDYNIILRKLTLLSYVHFCNVDFTIKEILKDPDEVQQLMHNLSIPPSVSEGLLNTTVNTKEVKRKKELYWTTINHLNSPTSFDYYQGAKKVSFSTACHEGKLYLACSSQRVILSSPPPPSKKKIKINKNKNYINNNFDEQD